MLQLTMEVIIDKLGDSHIFKGSIIIEGRVKFYNLFIWKFFV